VESVVASFDYRRHGKIDSGREHRLQIPTHHVGQLAERIAHVVINAGRRLAGHQPSSEIECLGYAALQQHGSLPLADEMDRRGQRAWLHCSVDQQWTNLQTKHGTENFLHYACDIGLIRIDLEGD